MEEAKLQLEAGYYLHPAWGRSAKGTGHIETSCTCPGVADLVELIRKPIVQAKAVHEAQPLKTAKGSV